MPLNNLTDDSLSQPEHELELPVLGMTCAACVRHVEKAIAAVPGVAHAEVNLIMSSAKLRLRGVAPELIAQAIRDAGYAVPADALAPSHNDLVTRIASTEAHEANYTEANRRRLVVAGVFTLPLVILAMSHGRLPVPPRLDAMLQALLATAVMLTVGTHYLGLALAALRLRTTDMNVLIALGGSAAYGYSLVGLVQRLAAPPATLLHPDHAGPHAAPLYFEAAATILFFVTLGKWLESRAKRHVSAGVGELARQLGATVLRIDAATPSLATEVDAATLMPGDLLRVRPGERIPVDGTVLEGMSDVDEALLTGEAAPVAKNPGAAVYAGTLNHQGVLTVRVARGVASSTLAKLAATVIAAQQEKAPMARLADRVSAVFVPTVLGLAALTFGAWFLSTGQASVALEHAVAVLVIACPCALGIATPAAVAVATARGAKLGMLFRGGATLEAASAIDTVLLDKTGTLTSPELTVQACTVYAGERHAALALIAALEHASEHPLAKAINAYAAAAGAAGLSATDIVNTPGRGLTGKVDGVTYRVGNARFTGLEASRDAATHVHLVRDSDNTHLATLSLTTSLMPDAPATLARLRALGLTLILASGDTQRAVAAVAAELGLPSEQALGGLSPEDKQREVARRLAAGHQVAMVGDGINDAPALAAATVGIAVTTGTEFAQASASVRLIHGGIARLPAVFELARAARRVMRQNLAWAFAFNVIGIPLAAGALAPWTSWQLTPMFASFAMSMSSVLVISNALRLRHAVKL